MVKAIRTFLEFCFIAWHNIHDTNTLSALDDALQQFHRYHEIFHETGVHEDFNPPWQHAMNHYAKLIRAFGALNGLCSSIMESKHIKAVKEPWQHSSHFEALCQMLLTNQCLNKLSAACADFDDHGMLQGGLYSPPGILHGSARNGADSAEFRRIRWSQDTNFLVYCGFTIPRGSVWIRTEWCGIWTLFRRIRGAY